MKKNETEIKEPVETKKSEKSEEKLSALKKAAEEAKKAAQAAEKEAEEAKKAAEEADEKAKEATDKMLRIAAEYDNFRKRAVKEKEDAYTDAYCDAVKTLLPVMDNLQRAKSFETEGDNTGTALIMKQLEECFAKLGVEEIPAKGLPFDPNFHNAVMMDDSGEYEKDTVTDVLQSGYTLRGKVIRFAMVKVAN